MDWSSHWHMQWSSESLDRFVFKWLLDLGTCTEMSSIHFPETCGWGKEQFNVCSDKYQKQRVFPVQQDTFDRVGIPCEGGQFEQILLSDCFFPICKDVYDCTYKVHVGPMHMILMMPFIGKYLVQISVLSFQVIFENPQINLEQSVTNTLVRLYSIPNFFHLYFNLVHVGLHVYSYLWSSYMYSHLSWADSWADNAIHWASSLMSLYRNNIISI